jgi:hypothetical protein
VAVQKGHAARRIQREAQLHGQRQLRVQGEEGWQRAVCMRMRLFVGGCVSVCALKARVKGQEQAPTAHPGTHRHGLVGQQVAQRASRLRRRHSERS